MFFTWHGLNKYLADPTKPIRVLIISSINMNHAVLLKDYIDRYYEQIVEVDIYQEARLDRRAILRKNYDIIITNFTIEPIGRALHLMSSDFPSMIDYMKLNRAINWTFEKYVRLGIA